MKVLHASTDTESDSSESSEEDSEEDSEQDSDAGENVSSDDSGSRACIQTGEDVHNDGKLNH